MYLRIRRSVLETAVCLRNRNFCRSDLWPERLRVPVRWLRAEAEAGRVPHVQAERVLLFDPETVERVLVERAKGTEAAR